MKKHITLLFCLSTVAFACLCAGPIEMAYQQLVAKVKSNQATQQAELRELQSNLKQNIENLGKQIKEKEIINALKKEITIRNDEIIFLLRKKLELER